MKSKRLSVIRRLFLNDKFIMNIILLNSILIFFEGYRHDDQELLFYISLIDSGITLLFIVEAIIKIQHFSWRGYIASHWNRLDFVLVILSFPSIVVMFIPLEYASLSFLFVFRIMRIFKFFRFFKFIPGISKLIHGVILALKTSIFVLVGLGVFTFIVAVLSCYLYKDYAPQYFADPMRSFYTTFRIFTLEGWYEIPDAIALQLTPVKAFLVKAYFVTIVISGGILGVSLVNSIFVDSMVIDNNDEIEAKIDDLNDKIEKLTQMIENQTSTTD